MQLSSLNDTYTKLLVTRTCNLEGFRSRVYHDPLGILTWGWGTNLQTREISKDEALLLLQNDLAECEAELIQNIPNYLALSPTRKIALLDMAYNMGLSRMMGFSKMLSALRDNNYALAAAEMLDSTWGQTNPKRCNLDATAMETNEL